MAVHMGALEADSGSGLIPDGDADASPDSQSEGKSSFLGAGFNIANSALGAGVLLFPQLMARNGYMTGTVSTLVGCLLMGGTLHILALAAHELKELTFQDAVAKSVHRLCAKGIDVTMSLYLFGTCASYLVLIADQIQALTAPHLDGRLARTYIIIVTLSLETPLMLLKDISALQATSAFGVFTNCYVALDIMLESYQHLSVHGIHPGVTPATGNVYALASAFGTYAFSFQCHLIFIPVYYTMRRASVRKMDGIIVFAYSICFTAYIGCGLLGYLAYGPDVASDILATNLPSNTASNIARACLVMKTFVSYPLLHFPARLCLGDLVVNDHVTKPAYRKQFYAVTAAFMLFTGSIAAVVQNLGFLVNLTSAALGVFQVFVWPGLMLWRMRARSPSFGVRWFSFAAGWGAVAFGLSVTVFGVWDQLTTPSK